LNCLTLSNKDYGDTTLTGAHHTFAELVRALAVAGDRVLLLAPSLPPGVTAQDVQLIEMKPARFVSRLVPVSLIHATRVMGAVFRNWRCVKQQNLDTIVVVGMTNGLVALPLKKLLGCRLALILPEDPLEYRKISLKRGLRISSRRVLTSKWVIDSYLRLFAAFERLTLLHADLIIVQSDRYRRILSDRYPSKSESLQVLPTPVNTSTADSRWAKANRSTELRRLGFVGSIQERKGAHLLLEAFREVALRHSEVALEFAGLGPLSAQLEEAVRRDPVLRGRVSFHGWLSSPLEFIAGCDLILVPSLSDSFPRTIGEALYTGTPVLGSKVGGIPEQLRYEELLFEPGAAESIVDKLLPLVESSAKYREVRNLCALRRDCLTFDWAGRLRTILEGEL